MTNEDLLAEAIRLIKAGQKDAARAVLEPFLAKNPTHIPAWMWEAELFPNNLDKIKILEACLKHNPGHPQVIQALNFLKNRPDSSKQSVPPSAPAPLPRKPSASVSPFSVPLQEEPNPSESSFPVPSSAKASPFSFSAPPPVKSAPSSSPFLPDPVVSAFASRQTTTASPPVEGPGHPQPPLPKTARPSKESKRMNPQVKNAILVVLVCIVLLALAGSYLGGGFYLNGQINKSFGEQNCADVVQHATFVLAYPKGVFASMFTGYDQYTECRLKLDVEQAVASKNWEKAILSAREYLAAYPDGPFAESMSEKAPYILSTWSEELIANHDYGGGIEKLKQLVEAYPSSAPAQPAPDAILQAYISWVKELTDEQKYADAEQRLNTALSHFQADPARSEQIKQELSKLYVDWGNMQIQLRDIDNGIKNYKKAGEIIPGKTDVNLLIARAYLQQASDIGETGNFDAALAKIQAVSDTAQAENIKSEAKAAREKILAAYSVSASQQAMDQMTTAISSTCQGQRPELPIFGLDTEKPYFGLMNFDVKLPVDRIAGRPSELRYVICISDTEDEVETCGYTGGYSLVRMRYIWQVAIHDILTGGEYDSKIFKGSSPEECPSQANFQVTSKVSRSFGKRPAVEEIVAWLDSLDISK